ncbi:T9SS type A sorting domain-containing protein [Hymenobacter sp. GOD-10R]|uniref:T9SS type A sorting domain-containing protein n=1 Tax=Hymenobacter sp. GOD-10R TaxID=3093922 RepID=UPI002D77477B|nr:T9SS type A sorting domain-containing protein [Hymenobacter sp. GOD-10R]WRQ28939.1 T9SS type A sorting domain-containing protein [Hymenobacter sp. GOD-10R]
MTNFYRCWLVLVGVLVFATFSAKAQYTFSNTNLNPYKQNFDSLGTGTATFNNNSTFRGIYATATLTAYPGATFPPSALSPSDGSTGTGAWYHFGYTGDTDRAFGGIAAGTGATGVGTGYIGVRLKNGTSGATAATIKSLEIMYAMEQWYNSGINTAAQVKVDYQISTTPIVSLTSGTWTPISALGVDAPSTTTPIAPRDGNSTTNRRVLRSTLTADIPVNGEIMIRWSYTFNSTTNGNGLSIDDVVITPQTNIFYSKANINLNLDALTTWGTATDGTGTQPASFSLPNTVYYVQGNTTTSGTSSSSRINGSAAGTWTVDGANSHIVVGVPGSTVSSRLYLFNDDDIKGVVDVESNGALAIQRPTYASTLTLGRLANTSTVEYYTTGTDINIAPGSYGNLKLTGGANKNLIGNVLVNGTLSFITASATSGGVTVTAAPKLYLGPYNLTIQRGGQIQGASNAAFVVTNGKGQLRQSVTNSGTDVLFPIGSSAASYTPALLQQPSSTTARNEDVFSVRVADGMYARYDASETGIGTAVTNQNVKKTWLVSEEVPGNSNITMGLQWNSTDEMADFVRNSAYVSHYLATGSSAYFDKPSEVPGIAAGTVASSYRVNRGSITSFSPFSVSSRPDMPLPVELTAFSARRLGTAVVCRWTTASERNSAKFIVERSTDGHSFQAIGMFAAAGTSTAARSYSFADQQPLTTTAYYRLRQIDEDATEAFSPVVTVAGCTECLANNVTIAPNPSSGLFELYTNLEAVVLGGTVSNTLGKSVLTINQEVPVGPQRTLLDLTQQPAGVYLVQLQTSSGSLVRKIVKQ